MTKRKQRHRPAAGIEVVYEDEHYSAIALYAPLAPSDPVIMVYSKPHHDLMFEALSGCLKFKCKWCRNDWHLLRWYQYNRKLQTDEPPYKVLCTQVNDTQGGEPWLVQAEEHIPDHLKARTIYTITGDMIELIASIAAHINNQQRRE
jgi:hypothetical protein